MDYDEIINFLTDGTGTGTWVRRAVTREPLRFQQSIIIPEAKMWMYFICAKFFPFQHVTEVTRERTILLHAI